MHVDIFVPLETVKPPFELLKRKKPQDLSNYSFIEIFVFVFLFKRC